MVNIITDFVCLWQIEDSLEQVFLQQNAKKQVKQSEETNKI